MDIVRYFENAKSRYEITSYKILKINASKTFLVAEGVASGKKTLIKIATKAESTKLLRERDISVFLDQSIQPDKRFYTSVTKFFEDEGYQWLLRDFAAGDSLTSYGKSDDVLMGYDKLTETFSDLCGEIVPKIVAKVQMLQKIEEFEGFSFANRRFREDFGDEECNILFKIHNLNAEVAINAFNLYKKHYYLEENIVISTSDLVPPNVIITPKSDIILTDFEWMTRDNYMLDFAQLWLYLWRYSNWQQELVSSALKSDEDRNNFRISIIRALLFFLSTALTTKQKNYYTDHIWKRYLIAAGESFEALINVK